MIDLSGGQLVPFHFQAKERFLKYSKNFKNKLRAKRKHLNDSTLYYSFMHRAKNLTIIQNS